VYPSDLEMHLGPAAHDHRIRAEIYAASLRDGEAGEAVVAARPSVRARLRAGFRMITTRRAAAAG
jgi:hypothetical protein